ncbi:MULTISPECIES: iron uptake porin [Sphaerospermopsis]|uniref:S-layer region-like protein n=1 Tax=Sphaerospermopsis reniformis TaxID=531300 RepID=A0A479ZX94_9CYAN|nr:MULTISPECIES: iron uptake porin [Sphaerospermopsis]MBD2134121.1 iron uptake porin [Sphaerospermopsis sp. FACHB-1094]MBD2147352.1 iron uptake porin [Sphaerospermopsis sp. FACHB-1194]GCL35928.1 S-layer region-like protein [Sphaerospermopsis reniformis]
MSSFVQNSFWIAPLLVAGSTMGVMAQTPTPETENTLEQVTSVSQLADVQPTDWAFQALQSLVERYGCIAGYPNSTFRGNRAMTRYEFAAGLNACLNRVQELIATSTADAVKKEDLETLQKLQQEYADGLVELRGRLDGLESRTAVLESEQFSTTTKLSGDVIFTVGSVFGGDRPLNSDQWRTGAARSSLQDNTIFSDRVRLIFDTSFSGKDRLRLILKANNTIAFNGAVSGTQMTRLGWDTTVNANNTVEVGKLFYNFPVGDKVNVTVDAIGGSFFDNFNTVNPLLSAATTGALSRFGRFSPIYRASNTGLASGRGAGVSAVFKLSDKITFSGGYLARNADNPDESRGLFDGTYGALAQLAFQPNQNLTLALAYAHSYFSGAVAGDVSVSGAEGSVFANSPFGGGVATSANHYGLQTSYRFSPQFVLSGWVGYTQAIAENNATNVNRGDTADIWNWAVTLGLPDLGKKGNLAGIIFGQPPKVTSNDFGPAVPTATSPRRLDSDTSYHLEALYRYQVNSNLSITPGLIVIFNPEHNSNNDTIYTGVIRTTFRF